RVYPEPPLAQLQLEQDVAAIEGDCGDWRTGVTRLVAEEDDRVVVRFGGAMPAGCGERYWALSLLPNQKFIWGVFRAMWQDTGGTLAGSVRDGLAPHDAAPFATLESESAAEIVRDMNKYSSNIIARQVFLT